MSSNGLGNFISSSRGESSPSIVAQKAKEMGLNPVYFSTRKAKKYMIQDDRQKWIHFGQKGYEDFTAHNDEKRRDKFRSRNRKWATARVYSPAWLSYYLLW